MTTILILCSLPWLFVLFHETSRRGFALFLFWLLISPVATNIVTRPGENPLFRSPAGYSQTSGSINSTRRGGYFGAEDEVKLKQLVEPSRTLLISFCAVFLLNAVVKRGRLGPFNKTEIWMAVFSTILLGSVFLQANRFDYSMRVASDAFLVPFAAYFITRRYVKTEEHLRQLTRVICWAGFTIIVICLVERMVHSGVTYRLAGPFQNPGIVFTVVMVALVLALLDTVDSAGPPDGRHTLHVGIRRSILWMGPVIIMLTWARSNYVGFLAGSWMLIFLGRKLVGRSQRMGTVALVLIGVLVVGVGAALAPSERISSRIGDSGTVYGRFATWKIALEEGISHPVFGIGVNNSRDALAAKRAEFGGITSWISVHNSFLRMFAEHGFSGLVAYLAIVASILGMGLNLYRTGMYIRDRWRGVAVIVIMVAYLVPGLFASSLHEPYPMSSIFVYVFMGAIAGVYGYRFKVESRTIRNSESSRGEQVPLIPGRLRIN